MFNLRKKSFKKFDFVLFFTVVVLCIFGLIVLKSATLSYSNPSQYINSQIIATLLGFVAILILILLDYQFLGKLYIPIYIVSNLLLIAVLIAGTGDEQWGAKSWLYIGGFGFQPAEFTKIGLIISLSKGAVSYLVLW